MKSTLTTFLLVVFLTSCSGTKKTVRSNPRLSKADKIVALAQSYSGTRYKFGGTTSKGMDCSGLIYTSFKRENIPLPRVSREMAKKGVAVRERNIKKGDLLFFQTSKTRRRINHVGLVTKVNGEEVFFIHATTSRGVLTSNLKERYWDRAFVTARRLL